MTLAELETPAVIILRGVLERNLARMQALATEHGVTLRPHAKTHKLAALAHRQLAAGAVGLTVAKLAEAEVMVASGVGDVFIANQIVSRPKLLRLAALSRIARVAVGVDSPEGAQLLAEVAAATGVALRVRIELDSGLGRCGVPPGEPALDLARLVAAQRWLALEGVYTHAGHAYAASSHRERDEIGRAEGESVASTASLLESHGIPCPVASVGSTPTARSAAAVAGVTELRPGNYVFHDAMQVGLGVATWDDCALRVVATVISRPAGDRATIDAGSKALGTERGGGLSMVRGHGHIIEHPDATLERVWEEHGLVRLTEGGRVPRIGERLTVVPAHACYVANLAERVALVEDGEVLAHWPVTARGAAT